MEFGGGDSDLCVKEWKGLFAENNMATQSLAEEQHILTDDLPLRRFTVEEYYALGEAGVLGENDHVELLDGVLVMMSPINPPHAYVVGKLGELLTKRVPSGVVVRLQQPITLSTSAPQPDVVIALGAASRYRERHPGPDDILLIIEVSDTTLRMDRRKAKVYAAAGIPEYWIIDVVKCQVEVRKLPPTTRGKKIAEYDPEEIFKPRDEITFKIKNRTIRLPVSELLP